MATTLDLQYREAVEKLTQMTAEIEKFVKGSPDEFINTDTGPVKTLAGIQEELFKTRGLVECVSFDTKSLMEASALPVESLARVTADPSNANNGTYIRKSTGWRFYEWIDLADMLPKPDTQNNSIFYLNPTNLISIDNIVYKHRFGVSPIKNKMAKFTFTITAWTNEPRGDTGILAIENITKFVAISGNTGVIQATGLQHSNMVSSIVTTAIPTFTYEVIESVEAGENVLSFRLLPLSIPEAESLFGKVEVNLEFYSDQLV